VRFLVAPDSFKGTFTAVEVTAALATGLERAGASVDRCPVADGGEGTLEVLLAALGGSLETVTVLDPLGREIEASFAVVEQGAIVEMASASGLALLKYNERDPWTATTYGTGQLIRAAAQLAPQVIVTVGGSATVDGGRGAVTAISDHGGLSGTRLVVLCDVRTTWERCAAVYGPQKGADPALVRRLADRLEALAEELPRDPRGIPGGGAAGGLAGGLWAACGAELEPGAPYVLRALDFDARLGAADAVICGEGRLDFQSREGKIVGEIADRARKAGVPAHAVVGQNRLTERESGVFGLASVREAGSLEALEQAGSALASLPAPV
jgi:glycerate kinase